MMSPLSLLMSKKYLSWPVKLKAPNQAHQFAHFVRRTLASSRRCARRYMPMRLIIFIFLSVICSGVFAVDCPESAPSKHEAVTITPDSDPASGMYHVRAPREFDG